MLNTGKAALRRHLPQFPAALPKQPLGVADPQSENFVSHRCANGPRKIAREATHRQTHALGHINHLNGTREITKNKTLGSTDEYQIPGPSPRALTGQHPTHWHIHRFCFGSMPLHAPIELSDRHQGLATEIPVQAGEGDRGPG
jgi:hypothetical protein